MAWQVVHAVAALQAGEARGSLIVALGGNEQAAAVVLAGRDAHADAGFLVPDERGESGIGACRLDGPKVRLIPSEKRLTNLAAPCRMKLPDHFQSVL